MPKKAKLDVDADLTAMFDESDELDEPSDGHENVEDTEAHSVRLDPDERGPRDARDLAVLLRNYPYAVNQLRQLDELEKAVGVAHPDPWEKDPVDMLEEARRFSVFE